MKISLQKILNILLDKLVRSKVKNNFGGRLEAFVSGGGPLDSRVGEALNALGLKTLQGYGLTETSPVVSCNPLQKIKVETVGPIFPGVEVKLANDGEILVRGENLMIGYWNKIYYPQGTHLEMVIHSLPLPLTLNNNNNSNYYVHVLTWHRVYIVYIPIH